MMQKVAVPPSLARSASPAGSAIIRQDGVAPTFQASLEPSLDGSAGPPPLQMPKAQRALQRDDVPHLASPQHSSSPSLPPASSLPPALVVPQAPVQRNQAGSDVAARPQGQLAPGDLVEGAQAEFWSESNRCWMPCVVVYVDAETGGVKLNVKPNLVLSLQEQQQRLRPRTRPGPAQLEWVRRTLREGRLENEAQALFQMHAKPSGGRDPNPLLRSEDMHAAGADIDTRLGISGCFCALKHVAAQAEGQALTAESFSEVFWELLWGVQKDFCQALPRERGAQRRLDLERPEDVYSFERTLGQGTFGLVMLARSRASGAERAVKMINKKEYAYGTTEMLEIEIEHLCLLDHPHVVRLYEHFEDATHIYLVMDFCSGGELEGMVTESRQTGRHLPELFVADVMRQVLLAIAHVHARGIVHLDLKSTNIMLMPSKRTLPPGRAAEGYTLANINENPHVMVIDLGVAQIFRPGNFKFNRPMGTPATMAPEVWKGEIHPKADVFSCGVVLFELLGLCFPFACPADLIEAVRYWNSKPFPPWGCIQHSSDYAEGLCKRMITHDRRGRPTASQCLQAPFLLQAAPAAQGDVPTAAPPELLRLLPDVPKRSVLYRSVALSIARVWPSNQLPSIKRLFHELDTLRSGRLGLEQLEAALVRLGSERTVAREAAEAMDLSRDGTVCWTEFVAACIDLGSGGYEQELQQIFNEADSDKDGLLSQQDISKLLLADHLREDHAVRDIFADLAGRTDPGARVDWPGFLQHFRPEGTGRAGPGGSSDADAADAPIRGPSTNTVAAVDTPAATPEQQTEIAQQGVFIEQARGLVEWARGAILWPEQRSKPAEPAEEDLQKLAEMGFTDRERCIAVLRKHHNICHFAVEELMEGAA